MAMIVLFSVLLSFLSYGLACNISCKAVCAVLNAESSCYDDCGCEAVPQIPRNPILTRQFVLKVHQILKTHAPLCNRSCLDTCSDAGSSQEYSECFKRCECRELLNGELWVTQLPQELWGEVRPKYLISNYNKEECHEKCEYFCSQENDKDKSACVDECYQIVCAEKPSLSSANLNENLPTSTQLLPQIMKEARPATQKLHYEKHQHDEEESEEDDEGNEHHFDEDQDQEDDQEDNEHGKEEGDETEDQDSEGDQTTDSQKPDEHPLNPAEDPSKPAEEPSKPVEEPSNPAEKPSNPTEKPSNPVEEPSNPVEDPSKPAEEPSKPLEEPSNPAEEPSKPVEEPSKPVEEPSNPVEEPSNTVEKPSNPVEEPSKPVEEPSNPVEEPSNPVEEPSNPAEEPSKPVEEPSNPAEVVPDETAGGSINLLNLNSESEVFIPQESIIEENGWSLIIVQLLLCISFIGGAVWLYINMRLKRAPTSRKYKYEEGTLETPYISMNKLL